MGADQGQSEYPALASKGHQIASKAQTWKAFTSSKPRNVATHRWQQAIFPPPVMKGDPPMGAMRGMSSNDAQANLQQLRSTSEIQGPPHGFEAGFFVEC